MTSIKLLLLSIVLIPISVFGQEKDLDQIILSQIADFHDSTEVAIALIKGDEVQFIGKSKATGEWSKADHQHSIFGIGSITKVFTSLLFSQAILDGKVKATDSFLKHYNYAMSTLGKDITLTQLANHTSGLPRLPSNLEFKNPADPYANYYDGDLASYLLKDIVFSSEPGSKYAYSNLGTTLLGFTISHVYAQPYETLYLKRIFEPLSMKSTSLEWSALDQNAAVPARDGFGNKMKSWDFKAHAPAGAIKSTPNDMSKFIQAFINEKDSSFSQTLKPTFDVNENLQIGMGWHISKTPKNQLIYWHNGATGGYRAFTAFMKEEKMGVVVLSNVSAFHTQNGNIDVLGFQLLKALQK